MKEEVWGKLRRQKKNSMKEGKILGSSISKIKYNSVPLQWS